MKSEEFEKKLNYIFDKIKSILEIKEGEYARNLDRLNNFKRAALLKKTTPERALEGMWTKHIISIYDQLDDLDTDYHIPFEIWEEKLIDSINYHILLYCLLWERYYILKEI